MGNVTPYFDVQNFGDLLAGPGSCLPEVVGRHAEDDQALVGVFAVRALAGPCTAACSHTGWPTLTIRTTLPWYLASSSGLPVQGLQREVQRRRHLFASLVVGVDQRHAHRQTTNPGEPLCTVRHGRSPWMNRRFRPAAYGSNRLAPTTPGRCSIQAPSKLINSEQGTERPCDAGPEDASDAVSPEPATHRIRNFSDVAHIDHGKRRWTEPVPLKTGAISQRDFRPRSSTT